MQSVLPSALLLVTLGLGTSLYAQSPSPATPTAAPAATPPASASSAAPTTDEEKIGYAIGVNIAENLKREGVHADPQFVAAGIRDGSGGGQLQMTQDQVMSTLRDLQTSQRAKMQEAQKTAGAANQAEGTKFLADNKTKPGVVALPDGLQYKVLTQGNGATPKSTDTVTVNYRGTLINGTEFDSSYKRKEPATFPVSGVIKGWTEVLQLMKVGSKYQVFIPSDLAYGEHGAGRDIGPNATLIFEVELVGIK